MRRTSQSYRMEAPIGGWNTRDSLDNIPPSDAIVLTNWIPDLGELRTRPGYTEHCWMGDIVSGSELVSNPGFETAGGGGADVFANWVETAGSGSIAQNAIYYVSGSKSCALTTGIGGNQAYIAQTIVTSASTFYRLSFWARHSILAPGFPEVEYRVYDASNSADIIPWTAVSQTVAEEWHEYNVNFETTTGGVSTIIYLRSPASTTYTSVLSWFDDVSVKASVAIDDIETLAVYEVGSTNKLLAFDSANCVDVSTAGTPTAVTNDGTDFTNGRWQWVNFDGKIMFVNGIDEPKYYPNGSGNLADFTGGNAITGPTETSLIGVNVFKNRTWVWEDGSQDVWYSALNTMGGAYTQFPLSRVGQFGGNLISMVTWTRDGGSGPDDFAVFIMSSGEAIVYQGSSPSVGGDWALVGVYDIGEPLSVRSVVKYGGDVWIITRLDYVNLAQVLAGVEANAKKSKVVGALKDALGTGGSLWGWEANIYPKGNLAIFNIPEIAGTKYIQHVMNTVTGSWCKFEDIVAHTWQVYDSRMFFGSADGYVYEFDTAQTDAGAGINSEMQTAWLPIGGFVNKMFTAIREFFKVNAELNLVNQFAVDYEDFADIEYPVAVASGSAEWGDPWGTPWTAYDQVFKNWEMTGLYGEVISLRKRLSTKQRVRYLGASWLYEPGERL